MDCPELIEGMEENVQEIEGMEQSELQITPYTDKTAEAMSKLTDLQNEKEQLQMQNKILQNRVQDLERNKYGAASNVSGHSKDDIQKELDEALERIQSLQREKDELVKNNQSLSDKVNHLEKQVDTQKNNYTRMVEVKDVEIDILSEKIVLLAQHNIELLAETDDAVLEEVIEEAKKFKGEKSPFESSITKLTQRKETDPIPQKMEMKETPTEKINTELGVVDKMPIELTDVDFTKKPQAQLEEEGKKQSMPLNTSCQVYNLLPNKSRVRLTMLWGRIKFRFENCNTILH